jgi:transposase
MLKPGLGRTHRAYLWSYSSSEYDPFAAVIYDFTESRSGAHARAFLGSWSGKLVCDDYSGYKALFERGVVEIGCMAHARRKLHDLYVDARSDVAEEGLRYFTALYEIEREARERHLDTDARQQMRQRRAKPIAEALRQWLTRQRGQVPDGSATAKAIQYSLRRWAALIRYIDDGDLPIDNNHIENQIRPVALGRNNWLFAGSLRAGQRAAAIMSLIQSAKLNGHDPYVYLRDTLERLPIQPASRLEELMPHRWSKTPVTH